MLASTASPSTQTLIAVLSVHLVSYMLTYVATSFDALTGPEQLPTGYKDLTFIRYTVNNTAFLSEQSLSYS